jgi:hypothetical protein
VEAADPIPCPRPNNTALLSTCPHPPPEVSRYSITHAFAASSSTTSPFITFTVVPAKKDKIINAYLTIPTENEEKPEGKPLNLMKLTSVVDFQFTGLSLKECDKRIVTVTPNSPGDTSPPAASYEHHFIFDSIAPTEPSNLSMSSSHTLSSSPQITWEKGSDNCKTVYYQAGIGTKVGATDVQDYKDIVKAGNSTVVTDLNLEEGVEYFVSVRSIDYAGNTSESIANNTPFVIPPPPDPVTDLEVIDETPITVTLKWQEPNGKGTKVWGYRVFYKYSEDEEYKDLYEGIVTKETTAKFKKYIRSKFIYIKIVAVNSNESEDSEVFKWEFVPDL